MQRLNLILLRDVSDLLAACVRPGEIVRIVSSKHGVSDRTAKRYIKLANDEQRAALASERRDLAARRLACFNLITTKAIFAEDWSAATQAARAAAKLEGVEQGDQEGQNWLPPGAAGGHGHHSPESARARLEQLKRTLTPGQLAELERLAGLAAGGQLEPVLAQHLGRLALRPAVTVTSPVEQDEDQDADQEAADGP